MNFENPFSAGWKTDLLRLSWNLFFVHWLIDYLLFDITWFCFCVNGIVSGFIHPFCAWLYWLSLVLLCHIWVPNLCTCTTMFLRPPYLWLRPGPECLWCSRVYILWWSSWKAFGRLSLMSPHSVPGWCQVQKINSVFFQWELTVSVEFAQMVNLVDFFTFILSLVHACVNWYPSSHPYRFFCRCGHVGCVHVCEVFVDCELGVHFLYFSCGDCGSSLCLCYLSEFVLPLCES